MSAMIRTADGKYVAPGAEVFNYYDCYWGFITSHPEHDGWFEVEHHGERGTTMLNGERISTTDPQGKARNERKGHDLLTEYPPGSPYHEGYAAGIAPQDDGSDYVPADGKDLR